MLLPAQVSQWISAPAGGQQVGDRGAALIRLMVVDGRVPAVARLRARDHQLVVDGREAAPARGFAAAVHGRWSVSQLLCSSCIWKQLSWEAGTEGRRRRNRRPPPAQAGQCTVRTCLTCRRKGRGKESAEHTSTPLKPGCRSSSRRRSPAGDHSHPGVEWVNHSSLLP
eukprot:SAG22_NODE_370_length_11576_cov_83.771456_3_plen_168_part_00